MHKIVIVGGGAGGLELATRLGNRLGARGRAHVTLIDRARTHLWKPLLHEVAAGSMDPHLHQLDYAAQARWHHFSFVHGGLKGLDRKSRVVALQAILDENGEEVIPEREIEYDSLVICIGSRVNDFRTPGVSQFATALDDAHEADRFHGRLVNACIRADAGVAAQRQLRIAIVGGGATGVELAAELRQTTAQFAGYLLNRLDPLSYIKLTLINADARILPALPERLSQQTTDILKKLSVEVLCSEQVVEVRRDAVITKSGRTIDADLIVWAAGIQAPAVLGGLDGLEVNRLNQLIVLETLQTTLDENVFAFGDCAQCPWSGHSMSVPPRAQAAHQQASTMARSLIRRVRGEAALPFRYRDFGSLVSLGHYSTVGSLMGLLGKQSLAVEGLFARIMYVSLYKLHLAALHGWWFVTLDALSRVIRARVGPRVKLH